jgi:hypothetical protein
MHSSKITEISRQGFTDFPGQQPQLSPTGLCVNYKGEVPENGVFAKFGSLAVLAT